MRTVVGCAVMENKQGVESRRVVVLVVVVVVRCDDGASGREGRREGGCSSPVKGLYGRTTDNSSDT